MISQSSHIEQFTVLLPPDSTVNGTIYCLLTNRRLTYVQVDLS